jgi:hypothetical protein
VTLPGYEEVLRAKEDAEARLRALPGVHAVGIGRKRVAGNPIDELAIVVFLTEKKPLDRLPPEAVVPPEIDGVQTDVVEMEIPQLLAGDPANLVATPSTDRLSLAFTGHDPPGDHLGVLCSSPGGPAAAPSENRSTCTAKR